MVGFSCQYSPIDIAGIRWSKHSPHSYGAMISASQLSVVPLVSYIVVTHDRDPELVYSRIITSILQQSHPRKELILIGENCPNLAQLSAKLARCTVLERI